MLKLLIRKVARALAQPVLDVVCERADEPQDAVLDGIAEVVERHLLKAIHKLTRLRSYAAQAE